jgi:hypothetical protein
MKSDRKFYQTRIVVTVLSEDKPYDPNDLNQVAHDITSGDHVGNFNVDESLSLDPKDTADALYNMGSEPDFFRLTDEGEDRE